MVSEYAPPGVVKFLSYITGWLTCLAWESATASSGYLGGTMIQGLIVLNNPTYVPQRWQGTLLFYAVILVGLFFNTLLVKFLPKVEGLILIIHIGGFFAVLIPLVYTVPHGSASDVFRQFENGGGWSTQGLSFFVGIVTGVYSFLGQYRLSRLGIRSDIKADILETTGVDGACHMGKLQ